MYIISCYNVKELCVSQQGLFTTYEWLSQILVTLRTIHWSLRTYRPHFWTRNDRGTPYRRTSISLLHTLLPVGCMFANKPSLSIHVRNFLWKYLMTNSHFRLRNVTMLFRRTLKTEKEDGAWGIMPDEGGSAEWIQCVVSRYFGETFDWQASIPDS
jgi:hypothetical protein